MTKRALHIINGEFFAGAERVQDLLAMRLPDFGYDCGFFCLKSGAFNDNRRSIDSPLFTVPMKSRFDFSVVSTLRRVLREGNYDILHTHTVRGALIARLANLGRSTPIIHHVHSPTRRDTEDARRNKINAFVEEKFVFPGTKKLVAVSGSLQQYLDEVGVSKDHVKVVPNGVPVDQSARSWTPPDGLWTIGVVALFRPRKGLDVMLSALHKLLQNGRQVRLRVVGGFETPEYERTIKEQAASLGITDNIDWVGFSSDVSGEMAAFDIFALPSLYGEGLPMVLIEAMAQGRPCVGTNVEGIPEVIGHGGAGVLVKANDAQSLADGIASIIVDRDAATAIAKTGMARQNERYSDVAMARSVAKIYDQALAQA